MVFNPSTLETMLNLASCYQHKGKIDNAIWLAEDLLQKRREVSGSEHPETLNALHHLVFYYDSKKEKTKALAIRKELSEIYNKMLGPSDSKTVFKPDAFGWLLRGKRRYKKGV